MAWWNKSKKLEENVLHQPQGLLSSLGELRRQEQSEADASDQRRQQERREIAEQERQRALLLLKSQLFYCFGVNASPQQNPTQVEGMWFGVGRYFVDCEGYVDPRHWYISLLMPCKRCQTLRPGYVSVITEWDERKAEAQKRIKNQTHNPYGGSPKSWEEIVAMSQNGAMVNVSSAGKTKKQLWIETLADYQTKKNRGLARYLRDVETGHNRFFGNCPGCGDYSENKLWGS